MPAYGEEFFATTKGIFLGIIIAALMAGEVDSFTFSSQAVLNIIFHVNLSYNAITKRENSFKTQKYKRRCLNDYVYRRTGPSLF